MNADLVGTQYAFYLNATFCCHWCRLFVQSNSELYTKVQG